MTRVRPARTEDLPAITAIVDEAYAVYVPRMGKKPGPMLDDYAARIAAGEVAVLEDDAGVAGLIVLIDEGDTLLLDNVAVAARARGHGFGRALIAFAEEAAGAAGKRRIRLYTHVTMVENIALYPRLGYAETHRASEKGFQRIYFEKRITPLPDASPSASARSAPGTR